MSRRTEVRREDLPHSRGLTILSESTETGLCLVDDALHRSVHMFNHLEYDSTTLADEYNRDVAVDTSIAVPKNYFPHDDCSRRPENRWRSHAHLLFGNWLNEIYQTVPFDWVAAGSR